MQRVRILPKVPSIAATLMENSIPPSLVGQEMCSDTRESEYLPINRGMLTIRSGIRPTKERIRFILDGVAFWIHTSERRRCAVG